jgi:hypothetical protein
MCFFLSPICKLQMGNVISQAYERDGELVSMNRNEYFIVYFYHVTKIFFNTFSMWQIFF